MCCMCDSFRCFGVNVWFVMWCLFSIMSCFIRVGLDDSYQLQTNLTFEFAPLEICSRRFVPSYFCFVCLFVDLVVYSKLLVFVSIVLSSYDLWACLVKKMFFYIGVCVRSCSKTSSSILPQFLLYLLTN